VQAIDENESCRENNESCKQFKMCAGQELPAGENPQAKLIDE
jgi:hypothetical protein